VLLKKNFWLTDKKNVFWRVIPDKNLQILAPQSPITDKIQKILTADSFTLG